jgi:hypothetical protein
MEVETLAGSKVKVELMGDKLLVVGLTARRLRPKP